MKKVGFTFTDEQWALWYPPFAAKKKMPMIEDPETGAETPEFTEEEHVSDVLFTYAKLMKRKGVNILKIREDSIYD